MVITRADRTYDFNADQFVYTMTWSASYVLDAGLAEEQTGLGVDVDQLALRACLAQMQRLGDMMEASDRVQVMLRLHSPQAGVEAANKMVYLEVP